MPQRGDNGTASGYSVKGTLAWPPIDSSFAPSPFASLSSFFSSFPLPFFLTLHSPIQVISNMSASKVYVGAYNYRSTLSLHFTFYPATPPRASFGDSSTSLLSYSKTAGEGRCSNQQQQKVQMLSSNDALK